MWCSPSSRVVAIKVVVNPNDILHWLTTQLRNRGVKFIRRELSSMQDLQDLNAVDALVNASGLGARDLVTDPQPDRSLRPDILERVNTMTNGRFDWVDLKKHGEDVVGFRPAREGGVRVEREGHVVHAYGVGGLGYLYAFGVAERVKDLVEASIKAKL